MVQHEIPSRDETPPRTGARRRLAPEARTPQILEAAFAEFAERGYAGARMAGVATRAGIAKGLIYHYFPSKSALFLATFRAATGPAFEAAERRIFVTGGPVRAMLADLIGVAYARLREAERERALFRLMVAEADRFPELARFYREEVLSRAAGLVHAMLHAGVASGEFRPEVAEMPCLAEAVMAPAVAGSVWRLILGKDDAPDLAALQAAHLDLLLAGLAVRQAPAR
ncbi:MAG: TetR/AcrR family transcriptional regulator [Acetobacteraceae bacterium]|nr:TetR/AcrR family transcriptional regulator [Acetobacteraceae bacterium]